MPFAIGLIAIILIVVAFNNTNTSLVGALESDIPGFLKWGLAIAAIAAIGYVPGLKTPSRWLLALVALVVVLVNGQTIIAGLKSFATSGAASSTASGASSAPPDPTAAYVASAGQSTSPPSATSLAGGATTGASAATAVAANPFNPATYLSAFEGSIGFGGLA